MTTQWTGEDKLQAIVETPKPKGIVRQLLNMKYGNKAKYHYHKFDPATGQFPREKTPTQVAAPVVDIVELHHPAQWLRAVDNYQKQNRFKKP